jgi:hypothetical protein
MILNGKWIRKELALIYFKVLSRHSPGKDEANHERHKMGQSLRSNTKGYGGKIH